MNSDIEPLMSLLGNAGIRLPTVYSAMLIQYSFRMSATLLQSLAITLFLLKMIWQLLVLVLWEINGLTVFQNSLLIIMTDWHLSTKYRFTAFHRSLMHRLHCFLNASLSLSFLVLLYFVSSWDIFMIALLRSLFITSFNLCPSSVSMKFSTCCTFSPPILRTLTSLFLDIWCNCESSITNIFLDDRF